MERERKKMSDMDKYNNDSETSEENRNTEVSDVNKGNASVKDTEHKKQDEKVLARVAEAPEDG